MSVFKIIYLSCAILSHNLFCQTEKQVWKKLLSINKTKNPTIRINQLNEIIASKGKYKDSVYAKIFNILGKSYQEINDLSQSINFYKKSIHFNSKK